MKPDSPATPDLAERGAGGKTSDRRLYIQLLAWTECNDPGFATESLAQYDLTCALYEDVNDPFGLGLAIATEDPEQLIGEARRLLRGEPFVRFVPKPRYTMLGRTYSIGYEPDLDETLIDRPRRNLLNADWPWAIWYPLRRKGKFARLDDEERKKILAEHGRIGHAFGTADLAHDIRLACHGLMSEDYDFIVGLVGAELTPLSKVVETMRPTRQTSRYIETMGPFFVGRKIWQSQTP